VIVPGGFYHRTIPYANPALELMAKNTGAFEAIFNNDLENLKYPKIKEYDAVFLNSIGSVFSDGDAINGLIRYVREGGGLAAIHGVMFASTDVSEYGSCWDNHRAASLAITLPLTIGF
jgi:hypothetical protein